MRLLNLSNLKLITAAENVNSDWRKITVRNGVLNLLTGELSDFNPDYVTTRYIDIEFIPSCTRSDRIENFINGLSGYTEGLPDNEQQSAVEKKNKLFEFIGYCFVSRNKFQKNIFLIRPRCYW